MVLHNSDQVPQGDFEGHLSQKADPHTNIEVPNASPGTGTWLMSLFHGKIGQFWQPEYNVGKDRKMADPTGGILTLEEVAAYLKVGKRTVYRLAQQGVIPAFKLGGTWRFRREELDRWIAASIEKNPKQGER